MDINSEKILPYSLLDAEPKTRDSSESLLRAVGSVDGSVSSPGSLALALSCPANRFGGANQTQLIETGEHLEFARTLR